MTTDRVLSDADRQFINRVRLAHVATLNPWGSPHVSPKGTFWATREGRAGFVHIRSGRTIRNLRRQPQLSASVIDIFQRRGVILSGAARVVEAEAQPDEFAQLVASFLEVRRELPSATRALVVLDAFELEHVTSPAYDGGAGIDEVEKIWRQYYQPDLG